MSRCVPGDRFIRPGDPSGHARYPATPSVEQNLNFQPGTWGAGKRPLKRKEGPEALCPSPAALAEAASPRPRPPSGAPPSPPGPRSGPFPSASAGLMHLLRSAPAVSHAFMLPIYPPSIRRAVGCTHGSSRRKRACRAWCHRRYPGTLLNRIRNRQCHGGSPGMSPLPQRNTREPRCLPGDDARHPLPGDLVTLPAHVTRATRRPDVTALARGPHATAAAQGLLSTQPGVPGRHGAYPATRFDLT